MGIFIVCRWYGHTNRKTFETTTTNCSVFYCWFGLLLCIRFNCSPLYCLSVCSAAVPYEKAEIRQNRNASEHQRLFACMAKAQIVPATSHILYKSTHRVNIMIRSGFANKLMLCGGSLPNQWRNGNDVMKLERISFCPSPLYLYTYLRFCCCCFFPAVELLARWCTPCYLL